MSVMKVCIRCHQEKSLAEFVPRKTAAGYTHYSRCRECWNRQNRERGRAARRANNGAAQVARAKARAWREANPEKVRSACRRWRDRHPGWMRKYREAEGAPLKAAARFAVHMAVKNGTLTKPACCEGCGREASGRRLQAHHEDYAMPLKVRWLCTACHGALHAPERVGTKQERRTAA